MIGINYLGIDIGSREIKIAYLSQFTQKIKIKDLISISTPRDAVEDGEIKNFDAIASKIERTVLSEKYKRDNVYLCVNSSKAALRDFSFTNIKLSELDQAVKYDLSQTYPGIVETNKISIKVHKKKGKIIEGVAAFCPKKILRGYEMIGEKTALKVKGIDITANAVAKAFRYYVKKVETNKPYLIVNIGANLSQVLLLQGGINYLSRVVYVGGDNIDNIVADKLHITQREAEDLKFKNYKGSELLKSEIKEIVSMGYGPIADQIQQTVKYYRTRNTSDRIEEVFLIGGGANEALIKDCCKDLLSFEPNIVRIDLKDTQKSDQSKDYLPAIGCALRGI